MITSAHCFVDGMNGGISGDAVNPDAVPAMAADDAEGRGLFAGIVSVYQSNEFLSTELKSVRSKLERARAYLESPGNNPLLARSHLDHLKARHSAVLTLLRANRLQARALLARTGDEAVPS